MIPRQKLIDAAQTIVELASHYGGAPHREMRVDGLTYGVLHERFGVRRQHHVNGGRIDFKQPGFNPVVIEFAVRTQAHLNEVYGSQNEDELRKLAKQVKMSARYLLLLDLSGKDPLTQDQLQKSYNGINAGRGRFPRKSVRVVYVHPEENHHFLWQPWAD